MKFEVNRQMMLAAAKGAARVAPSGAHTEVINGILVEGNDDTGEIFLTATNHESSIQYKVIGSVSERGTMLINARMLVGMLQLLDGEFVSFAADRPEVVIVRGGRCTYNINCLPAQGYPRPIMPFPEESVIMTGICSLAKRTVFAVSHDEHKHALQCVQIKLRNNAVHATACDGARLIMVKDEASSPDEREFLLPGRALQMLASISKDDDVFEVGDVGHSIVFTRGDMMFSVRRLATEDYIDTASIVRGVKPMYSAVLDAGKLKEAVDIIAVAAAMGSTRQPVNLILSGSELILRCDSDYSNASSCIPANVTTETPPEGFYYDVSALSKLLQVVGGKVRLELDSKGFALIKTKQEVYLQLPMRAPVKSAKPSKTKASAKGTKSAELKEAA